MNDFAREASWRHHAPHVPNALAMTRLCMWLRGGRDGVGNGVWEWVGREEEVEEVDSRQVGVLLQTD